MAPTESTGHGLKPADAADYLTSIGVPCHVETLKRWARAGRVRAIKTPGGWWKFSTADLDRFAESLTREPDPVEAAS